MGTIPTAIHENHTSPSHRRETAEQWGLTHPGEFAADNRRLFGELPSETLARG